jgi:hypothetical protein
MCITRPLSVTVYATVTLKLADFWTPDEFSPLNRRSMSFDTEWCHRNQADLIADPVSGSATTLLADRVG